MNRVGLAIFIYVLVLLTYWVSLRARVSLWCLALAGAGIGLTPLVCQMAASSNTDALVAWCSAPTIMIVSLEFRTRQEGAWAVRFSRRTLFESGAGSVSPRHRR
jgi:hypothetical protein